ncbi:MAG: type II secretion system minor pseudopilin GspK, partial [Steroidobacter sp.]
GYMDQRRTGIALMVDQAYEVALGGEAEAAAVLEKDFLDDQQNKNGGKYDGLYEDWARPVVLPIEDYGELRGNLEDLQGRFNLNNLVNANGTINQETLAQFTNLLERLQIDNRWAGIIADWIDADNNPNYPDGAEDSIYSLRTPAYLTANRPIMNTSELLALVDGSGKPFGMDNYRRLEPFVAALPINTPLNVCTAAPEIIDSLTSPGNTEFSTGNGRANLEENRKSMCFPKLTDIRATFQNDPVFKSMMQKHGDYLSETTQYFRANILVTLGTTQLAMYSVLQRTGNGKVHV